MAIINSVKGRFDESLKADKVNTLQALIFASKNPEKYKLKSKDERELTNQEKVIIRTIEGFDLYRTEGRNTYGGPQIEDIVNYLNGEFSEEKFLELKNKFNKNYQDGGAFGIWIDSNLHLSELATRVANHEITISRYLSIIFINLFSYQLNEETGKEEYFHFLERLLEYIITNNFSDKVMNIEKLKKVYFNFKDDSTDEHRNAQCRALFQYLVGTEFFVDNGNYNFSVHKTWQKKLKYLKSICNTKYSNLSYSEAQTKFDNRVNKMAYSNAISDSKRERDIIRIINDFSSTEGNPPKNESIGNQSVIGINKIFYGAPGTGKSYKVTELIKEVYPNFQDTEEGQYVFRTTLHPEYTYSDFIGQVMPEVEGEKIKYIFKPGVFTESLKAALRNEATGENHQVYLVLEELSRANVAAVFGDLFQLLDRDITTGKSEYSINNSLIAKEVYNDANKKIEIPANLTILGTVNTSDQNVFAMDTAFKRRFDWERISTKPIGNHNNKLIKIVTDDGEVFKEWNKFYPLLNDFITRDLKLGEDKQIGQFFIKFKDNDDKYNNKQFQNKLLQFLWEDVQKVSFSGGRLFDEKLISFDDIYVGFENDTRIFSKGFLSNIPYDSLFNLEEAEADEFE